MNRTLRSALAIVVAGLLIVILSLTLVPGASDAAPSAQRQFFSWIVTKRLTVQNATELQDTLDVWGAIDADSSLTAAGAISATGNITTLGNVDVTGDVMIGDDLYTVGDAYAGGTLGVTGIVTTSADATVGDDLYVAGDAYAGGTLGVTGAVTTSAAVDIGTNLVVGDWASITAQETIVLGDGETITPTGSYQPITSTVAVTTATDVAIAPGTAGQVLVLVNGNAADIITIDGTGGGVECKADVALGAKDTLTLLSDGTDWICLSGYDNS
jgi:hypothetical protein